MKKNIYSLAALLIASATFVACSSDDISSIENQQPANPTGKYTMTITASKGDGATTRALTLSGKTLSASWDAGEIVEVYQSGSKIGELTAAASTTKSTTLTGSFAAAPSTSADLTFYFHTNATPSYSGQDGTLTKIASTYDFCDPASVTTGNFSVDDVNKTISVPGGITFGDNKQAIAKFMLVDKANDAALNASHLSVTVDISDAKKATLPPALLATLSAQLPTYELNPTTDTYTANGGTGILFLAIPDATAKLAAINGLISPATLTTSDLKFVLTATVGSDTYTLTKNGFPFENGNYYEITAKMTKQAPALTITSPSVGQVIGDDGKNYAAGSLPGGVTAVAKICYVSGSNGLALALADEGQMNWSTAKTTCAAHTPAFTGGTWKLADKDEWTNMITAAGGSNNLGLGIHSYWTSTEFNAECAWSFFSFNGSWDYNSKGSGDIYVRACLAF